MIYVHRLSDPERQALKRQARREVGRGSDWKQHAGSVARALEPVQADRPLILVGYSAAGPLLPAIGRRTRRRVGAYIFADAGLPHGGKSWLEMLETETPDCLAHRTS